MLRRRCRANDTLLTEVVLFKSRSRTLVNACFVNVEVGGAGGSNPTGNRPMVLFKSRPGIGCFSIFSSRSPLFRRATRPELVDAKLHAQSEQIDLFGALRAATWHTRTKHNIIGLYAALRSARRPEHYSCKLSRATPILRHPRTPRAQGLRRRGRTPPP